MSVTTDRHRIVPDPGRERAIREVLGFDVEVHWTPDRDRTTVEFSTPDLDALIAGGRCTVDHDEISDEAHESGLDDGKTIGHDNAIAEVVLRLESLADEVTDDLTPAQVIDLALAKVRDL